MRYFFHSFSVSALALTLALGLSLSANAQDDDEVVVTATKAIKVSQGGAADIEFFKQSVENGYLPTPSAVTAEGLLYNYDLTLANTVPCKDLFCLEAETMQADMIVPGKIDTLVGLGFTTKLTHDTWRRDPLTIVAVVDKSGSMRGKPMEVAKASMREVLKNLKAGDRMSIVQYGSTTNVVIPVTEVVSGRADLAAAIDSIQTGGYTSMEAGLRLAFDTAYDSQPGYDGRTRVVLFSDEQPNVGATDSASFIGMARAASDRGVGMTTIGVAEHFGADLANKVSAARGGNLFYIRELEDVPKTLGGDFDLIMTELAHDLKVKAKPAKGVKIEEVYGVPGEDIKFGSGGSIAFTIPSVFLSSEGGGIFMGVSGEGKSGSFIDIDLSYVDARTDKKYASQLAVPAQTSVPSEGMKRAHTLVNEYIVVKEVTQAKFFGEDLTKGRTYMRQLRQTLSSQAGDPVYQEAAFIDDYIDLLGESEEAVDAPCYYKHCNSPVMGRWQVTKVRKTSRSMFGNGDIDIRKGDRIAFHLDHNRYDETEIFNLRRDTPGRGEAKFESESFGVDYKKREIFLYESDIKFDYKQKGEKLFLYPEHTQLVLVLEPV